MLYILYKKMDYFSIKAAFYLNDGQWETISNVDKANVWWQLAKNVAIAYPSIMQHLNKIGMNSMTSLNALHSVLKSNKQPGWSFISAKQMKHVAKTEPTLSEQCHQYDANIINLYCKANDIDKKTFNAYANFHAEELLKDLNDLKAQIE